MPPSRPTATDRPPAQRRVHVDAARVRARFLVTELRAGLTFLNVSAASRRGETAARTRAKAQQAYDTVARYLAAPLPDLTAGERAEIARLYAELGARLRAPRGPM